MNIDLEALMKHAQEEVDSQGSKGEGGNGYPVVYPGETGKITFRILYNVKSQTVQRRIIRHDKTPCMSLYGEECPACIAIKNAEEVKGKDCGAFRKYGYKIRGLCYAKVVDADSVYLSRFKVGDTIILMYPKSVYEDLNRIIVDAGANLEKIVAHNDGIPIVIETSKKANGMPEYKVYLFPYGSQKAFSEDNGEQLFDDLLNSLPSLSETSVPAHPTEEDRTKIKAIAETITQEFIYGNVVNPNDQLNTPEGIPEDLPFPTPDKKEETTSVNPAFTGMPAPEMPKEEVKSATQAPPVQSSGDPDCFGNHSDTDQKCLICPLEVECFKKSRENLKAASAN